MRLLTFKPTVKTSKVFEGLLECEFEHTISKADARLNYTGPAISPEVWQQMLAFFQWTFDTTHSESQVRLFVNTRDRIWAVWAFPQEARSGMTARELTTPEAATQRAQFSDAAGWLYFGTVHHHCSCSAFQSGTDTANEENQDGLHITIGNMGANRYDLHARFYLGGFKFEPDLSRFWDIGTNLIQLLPQELWDKVARHQMSAKVAPATLFPDEWKANLIEVKTATFPGQTWSPGASSGYGYGYASHTQGGGMALPLWQRSRKAIGAIWEQVRGSMTQKQLVDLIEEHNQTDTILSVICEVCSEYQCTLESIWSEIPHTGDISGFVTSYRNEKTYDELITRRKSEEDTNKMAGTGATQSKQEQIEEAWRLQYGGAME